MKSIFFNKVLRTSQIGLLVSLVTVLSCDTVDVDPDLEGPITEETSGKIFMMAGNTAIIDLSSKISSTQTVTVQITSETQRGDLTIVGSGLLQYTPHAGTGKTTDNFEYTVSTQDSDELAKDTVTIFIENDPEQLPTGIYPVSDIVYSASNSSPVTIDVLANDFLSTYSSSDILVSIYSPDPVFPPYYGSAIVNGSSIIYTPSADFIDQDKIVYKAALKSDPSVFALGSVVITNTSPCNFTLQDDLYISSEPFTLASIPALQNDQLCDVINVFDVQITRAPSIGAVTIEDGLLVYRLSNQAEHGFSDSFEYEVNIDGNRKTAEVVIEVDTTLSVPCEVDAAPDFIDLTDSLSSAVNIDVLQNDQLCGNEVELSIEVAPIHGTATIGTGPGGRQVIIYVPDAGQEADDKISYTISTGLIDKTNSVLIKRVK